MGMMRKASLFLSVFALLLTLTACQAPASSGSQSSGSGGISSSAPPDLSSSENSAGSSSSAQPPAVEPDVSQPAETPDVSQPDTPPDVSEPTPKPVEPEKPETPDPPPAVSTNHTLYILMYHSVVEGDDSGCNDWMTTTQHLREDLQWLKDHGYTSVLPSELASGTPLPEKAVLITFDDGYADNYQLAYPILQEFQAKAVIALIAERIQDGVPGFLTWDMCREMADSGLVEFGSHSYDSHREDPRGIKRMSGESREAYEARIFPDLEQSIQLIEDNVGQKVVYFAYPHGQTESWASDFLAQHFAVTVTTRHGSANTSGGLYDLNRFNINTRQTAHQYLPD